MRLTDIRLKALTPPEKGAKIYYCDSLQGFGVRVSQGGTKAFILATGKNRDRVTIGKYPIVGLAEAREVAKNLLAERQLGRHQSPKIALGAAIDLFTEQHVTNLAARTQQELTRLFTRYLPKLRTKKLADITTHDITAITDKAAPSEGEQFPFACKTFFRWCVRRRLIPHSPLEGLELPSKWKPRERVLTDDELRAVWQASDDCGQFGTIVKLLILTGQRRSEIGSLQANWCSLTTGTTSKLVHGAVGEHYQRAGEQKQVTADGEPPPLAPSHQSAADCELKESATTGAQAPSNSSRHLLETVAALFQPVICLPSTITKNKRSHTFPIGALAVSILNSVTDISSACLMFPARGKEDSPFTGWSKAKAQLDKKINILQVDVGKEPFSFTLTTENRKVDNWTLHDLRRTYATNLQRLGVKLEVIESLLNHISGTRAGIIGVYNRHRYEAEMREAVTTFEVWFNAAILRIEDL